MFCFYSAACCRSDGSIRAGAKLDRQSRGSVLALQHSRCGSLRGQKGRGSGLLLNFASSNIKHLKMIMILNYFCHCCVISDCLACVAFPRKKDALGRFSLLVLSDLQRKKRAKKSRKKCILGANFYTQQQEIKIRFIN